MEPLKDLIRIVFALRNDQEINNTVTYLFGGILAALCVAFLAWIMGLFEVTFV